VPQACPGWLNELGLFREIFEKWPTEPALQKAAALAVMDKISNVNASQRAATQDSRGSTASSVIGTVRSSLDSLRPTKCGGDT
jgi:hypothetical protein